jgi:hypothetical protein
VYLAKLALLCAALVPGAVLSGSIGPQGPDSARILEKATPHRTSSVQPKMDVSDVRRGGVGRPTRFR